jgi:hypothetical protein
MGNIQREKIKPLSLTKEDIYKVYILNSNKELKKIYNIDCEAYGKSNISFNILENWWKQYSKGIYIIKVNEEIIGALGIFPLSLESYNLLKNGFITEKEIIIDINNQKYWYISGIVIVEKYRKKRAIINLLDKSIKYWLNNLIITDNITIGSIPISKNGLRLLEYFNFNKVKNSEDRKDNYPFYEKIFNKK